MTKPEGMLEWSGKYDGESGVLCIWPGAYLTEDGVPEFFEFAKENWGFTPKLVGCVITLPDREHRDQEEPETGGRTDMLFYCPMKQVPSFAVRRFDYRVRWWEDVYFNNGEDIYPQDFLDAFPDPNQDREEDS